MEETVEQTNLIRVIQRDVSTEENVHPPESSHIY